MTYGLGVDLGTTFTGAAAARDDRAEMISLGNRSVVAPSVVFSAGAGKLLTGDAAIRRAMDDPRRAAREFKRRLGDHTPLMLGGSPYSPARLMAATLDEVLRVATDLEGMAPQRVVLTYPAVWGPYRREQFDEVPRLSDVHDVAMIAEPVAAATYYRASRELADGDVVAVYDLGGGTFDLTIVRVSSDDIEVLGHPEGVEWLGGIDFDEAILGHVDRALLGAVTALNLNEQQQAASLFRLRAECALAKEALSTDEVATIRVILPTRQDEVQITREEFEEMIEPALASTIKAMRRGLESADLSAADLSSVVLVGGSSRIPLVSRMVTEALQTPTVVNAHPKHAVALGAALLAARDLPTTIAAPPASVGPARAATPQPQAAARSTDSGSDSGSGSGSGGQAPQPRWRWIALLALIALVVLATAAVAGTIYGRAHHGTPGAISSMSAHHAPSRN